MALPPKPSRTKQRSHSMDASLGTIAAIPELGDDQIDPRLLKERTSSSTIGTLTIYIQQAQNLPAMDKSGKSDPYVKLRIADSSGNTLSAKTSIITESLNPKWYQSFTFNNIPISQTLKIKIYDFDRLSADDLMGSLEILLLSQSDQALGVSFDVKAWYFISKDFPDAKLQCRLAFEFLTSSEHATVLKNEQHSLRHTIMGSIGLKPSKYLPSCSGFGQPTKKSMQLRVHLFQARHLTATDANGLCDPYVMVTCCGQVTRSQVVKRNRDPQWYETLVLNILLPQQLEHSPDVHIRVFDHDRFSRDDVIGRFVAKPAEICAHSKHKNIKNLRKP